MNNIWKDRYNDMDKVKNHSTPTYNPHLSPDRSYFDALKGKTVTIYRGGPESKSGKLLDVQSDYLTLYTQNNGVIYYQAEHVKSISEDSKFNSTQHLKENEERVEYLTGKNFNELLTKLENEVIQINQGGPECKHGTLLAVRSNFLILLTEENGIMYVKLHHIKSVSKTLNNVVKKSDQETFKYPVLSKVFKFSEIFKELEHKWVSINHGGPEAVEGVLAEKSGDYYTLISNESVLLIHPFHIRSISSGPKGSSKQSNEENNDENKDKSKDGIKKDEQKDRNKYKSKYGNKKDKQKDGNKDENKGKN